MNARPVPSRPTLPSRSTAAHGVGPAALLLLLPVLLLLAGARSPAAPAPRIDQILAEEPAASTFWGVYVRDVRSGEVLYSRNAQHAFLPASNMKLLTTATALDALGGDHRYQTTLYFDGRVDGSVLHGDLTLEGSGDPSFGSREMSSQDPLRAWAEALAAMGVERIEGRLIGDDDAFDDRPYAEGWDIDYITTQASQLLGVSTGGLAYNDNLVTVRVRAEQPGTPPSIETLPGGYLAIDNQATTSARRRGRALDLHRSFGTPAVTVRGSIPQSYRGTFLMPVLNPTLLAVHTFRHFLQEEGIDVSALDAVDVDVLDEAPDLEEAQLLFVHLSPPLKDLLALVNKESNNFYADQIFRTYGWRGTAEGSALRTKALFERAGADVDALSIRDGSGLSRKNLVTPAAMVDLLTHMHDHAEAEPFLASLAGGGEPETTLRYRLTGHPVRAKTGSLEFVRALSGYATTGDGRTVAFAIFANHYTGPSYRITQAIDRIVMALTVSSAG